MSCLRFIATILAFAALSACMTDTPQSQTKPQMPPSNQRHFVYAHALFGDPVFDRDVLSFQKSLRRAFGAPEAQRQFGYNDRRLEQPTGAAVTAAVAQLAQAAVDGQDLVIVMLTSHGGPDVLAQKAPGGQVSGISANAVRDFLAPLSDDKQVIIIQACYSGSLIDELASPNRIILTAAAKDRSSFGCNPDNDNTFYIKALNQALRDGGSWSAIHARTQTNVARLEAAAGIKASSASLPQAYVGANMNDHWGLLLARN